MHKGMETMKPNQFFSLFLFLCLTACTPASPSFVPAGTVEMTNAIPGTSTPISTVTAEPTLTLTLDIPIPSGLLSVPEGYSAVHNADSWGYGAKNSTEVVPIPNLTVDASGAHFAFNGNSVDIPATSIGDRIKVGQEGALQIYNEQLSAIDYAWDTKNNRWVEASSVIQPDRYNTEQVAVTDTDEELFEEYRLEKMFMLPFPADTYWPDPTQLDMHYGDLNVKNGRPFGHLADVSKSPFRLLVNHFKWKDMVMMTEQVYNPADNTFSSIHFPRPGDNYKGYLTLVSRPGAFLMPMYALEIPDQYTNGFPTQMAYLAEKGYYSYGSNTLPKIRSLGVSWLTEKKVPEELEELPLLSQTANFIQ
jgi:hypothetical protein